MAHGPIRRPRRIANGGGAVAVLILGLLLAACGGSVDDPTTSQASGDSLRTLIATKGGSGSMQLPESDDFAAIPQDPRNPLTREKVALGRSLFHDTALGTRARHADRAGTYSCASCHHARAGFQSGRVQGLGEGGSGFGVSGELRRADPAYTPSDIDAQPLRSPSVLNVAYQPNLLWNGQFGAYGDNVGTEAAWTPGTPKEKNLLGYDGVETQAIAGVDVHRLAIDRELVERLGYREAFDAAFGDIEAGQRYSPLTAGLAIAAYERTLLANRAPFQRWLRGDSGAMSDAQTRGALLFFGKAGCAACHQGPALSSPSYHALGMADLSGPGLVGSAPDDATRKGRGGFTGRPEDLYRFKTPQLYNLADVSFLGHGASFPSVEAVLRYKNLAIAENPVVPGSALSPQFVALGLSEPEIADLAEFVGKALRDPDLARYQPVLAGNRCTPVADPVAIADLACPPRDSSDSPGDPGDQ